MVLVKKMGAHAFVLDYCKLNSVTRKDAYPILSIDDTLDGSRWFSTRGMVSGYWKVEVGVDNREKTEFCTPNGFKPCHLVYVMDLLRFTD